MFNIGKTIAAVGREPLSSSSTRVGFVCRFNGILDMSLSVKVSSFAVGVLLLLQTLSACAPTAPQNDSASTSSQQTSTSSQQATSPEQIVLAIPSNAESEEGYAPTLGWGRYGSPLFQSTLSHKLGRSPFWIAQHHMIPHVIPQLLVGLILLFPHAILHEAALSFIGIGLSPHTPALGIILAEAMRHLSTGYWWLGVMPGLLLLVVVKAFDTLGENIRALIDPKTSQG